MSSIQVIFILSGERKIIEAKTDELFAEVAFRYLQKAGLDLNNNPKFFFNSQEIRMERAQTLAEHKISNFANIDVILMNYKPPPITIGMKKEKNKILFQTNSDDVLAKVVKRYVEISYQKGKKLHYFYNSSELTDFTQTFQEYGIGDKAIIDVEECSHELCSKCCKCISGMKKEKNELNKRLNDEINKNVKLSKENEKLRKKLEEANRVIKQMEELQKNQIELSNNSTQSEYLITSLNPGDKILAVNFVSMGNQDIGHYNLICKNTDLFINLEERLYKDFPQFKDYNTFFTVNGKNIKRFKSIRDNNIKNNDIISLFINED